MDSKIICIGLSRTGTTALHEILLQLGFDSKHYLEELISNDDLAIVDRYDAIGDAPIPLIYQQLDKQFPDSKFILTTRDKSQWLESMKWMFRHGRIIWHWTSALNEYHKKLYGCKRFHKTALMLAFDTYHAEVREYFKSRPELLLEINIDNGFDIYAIAEFLNVPAKAVRVRRHSDRRNATAREVMSYYLRHTVINPIKRLLYRN